MEKDLSKDGISSKERLAEIVGVLKKHNILSGINPLKFRTILEELGPTFIKVGQILSNRPDLLSKEYIEELSKLRSDVAPMEFQEVLDILREEYDRKLFTLFLNIDRNRLGSASIAQVHRATLKDGSEVVIKVQRRNIKERMITDIKLLKKAVKLLNLQKIFNNIVSFDEILDELLISTLDEMNFLKEAEHICNFLDIHADVKYIRVPKVYKNLTTEKVLVMEYVEGVSIGDVDFLTNDGYELEEIAVKLAENYLYQVIDQGIFHADPHPDNIYISDGKIVYLDFGLMGTLSARNKELLEKCIYAIINDDVRTVEKILLTLGEKTGEVNHTKLCSDIERLLDKNKYTDIKDINIAVFAQELIEMLMSNNIKLPKEITMLARGIVVLEGTLEVICPKISLMQVLKEKTKNSALKLLFDKDNIQKELASGFNSLTSLNKIPSDLHNFLDTASRGEAKFNIEVTDSSKKIDRFEKMVHRIVVCILDVAFIVGAALIVANGVESSEQNFLFYLYLIIAIVFTIWLFIKMYIDKLNRKK
ncbi:MAG: AarF/ABC1/UbiB kinase family protein [Bacilli bacterium]|nr:AarF/ABC1/UbiB kinase family protein [Bacilli bacterium]